MEAHAQRRAPRARVRAGVGRRDLRRGRHVRRDVAGVRGARARAAWACEREPVSTQVVAARPPRRAAAGDRARRRRASSGSPPRSATSSAPRSARSRSRSAPARRARARCPTSATRSRPSASPASRACCAATRSAGVENVALWHERDISHSGAERVILPDSTILLDYLQHLAIRVVRGHGRPRGPHAREPRPHLRRAVLPARPARARRRRHDARRGLPHRAGARAARVGRPHPAARAARSSARDLGLDLDAIFDLGHYARYAEEIVGRLDELPPIARARSRGASARAARQRRGGHPCADLRLVESRGRRGASGKRRAAPRAGCIPRASGRSGSIALDRLLHDAGPSATSAPSRARAGSRRRRRRCAARGLVAGRAGARGDDERAGCRPRCGLDAHGRSPLGNRGAVVARLEERWTALTGAPMRVAARRAPMLCHAGSRARPPASSALRRWCSSTRCAPTTRSSAAGGSPLTEGARVARLGQARAAVATGRDARRTKCRRCAPDRVRARTIATWAPVARRGRSAGPWLSPTSAVRELDAARRRGHSRCLAGRRARRPGERAARAGDRAHCREAPRGRGAGGDPGDRARQRLHVPRRRESSRRRRCWRANEASRRLSLAAAGARRRLRPTSTRERACRSAVDPGEWTSGRWQGHRSRAPEPAWAVDAADRWRVAAARSTGGGGPGAAAIARLTSATAGGAAGVEQAPQSTAAARRAAPALSQRGGRAARTSVRRDRRTRARDPGRRAPRPLLASPQ